jgi:hypothetical protein
MVSAAHHALCSAIRRQHVALKESTAHKYNAFIVWYFIKSEKRKSA